MPLYAIVFNTDKPTGVDPDPQQDWHAGDLYSVGSVVADALPAHFDVIALDRAPVVGEIWSCAKRRFIKAKTKA